MILAAVQEHTLSRTFELPPRARDLYLSLRAELLRASNLGALSASPAEIYRHVQLLREPPPQLSDQLRDRDLRRDAFCIVGGEKNQERDRAVPHLARSDGAWFDFSIVGRHASSGLELLAYDFEVRFPAGTGSPFLRFDLNLPDHRNEQREMRCHLHPGADDILVPAPMMSPLELLSLCLVVGRPSTERGRRTLTAFEVSWLEGSHALARGAAGPAD